MGPGYAGKQRIASEEAMTRTCGNCQRFRPLEVFPGGTCKFSWTGHTFPDDGENCRHWQKLAAPKTHRGFPDSKTGGEKRMHGVCTRGRVGASKGRTK